MNLTLKEDLYHVFDEMLSTKKLVALHCIPLNFEENTNESLKTHLEFTKVLYSINEFAGSFNKNFINFGLDPLKFDFDHYPFMRDFVNTSKDHFTIIILRLNLETGKVEVFRKLKTS